MELLHSLRTIHVFLYIMKSLIPKGAKSTFVTAEKNAFLYACLWKTQY